MKNRGKIIDLLRVKIVDSRYIDHDGISHEDLESVICERLGVCGCGAPLEAIRYIKDCLQHIKDYPRKNLFNTDGEMYFIYNWLNAKGLTEHGIGLPGWLTDKGKNMLKILNMFMEG